MDKHWTPYPPFLYNFKYKNHQVSRKLFYEGRIVTRPAGLASSMNKFFIDKVKTLRQNIPVVATDPLKELKEAMEHR